MDTRQPPDTEPPAADKPTASGLVWPVMLLALLSAWLLAAASPAWAARAATGPTAESEAEPVADPPGRVGRISEVQGRVAWFDQQLGRWEEAERNLPLTSGDRLSTGDGARAELRIGSTVLRLDGGSELEVLRIDDERMVFQLHSGALALRVRTRELAGETVLLTGEVRALPQRAGHYRLGRRDDETRAGVWHGTLRLAARSAADEGAAGTSADRASEPWTGSGFAGNAELLLETGQYAELWRGPAAGADRLALRHRLLPPPSDAFAEWVVLDDRREEQRSAAQQHVSPEMTGAEDLDRHGRWERHPDYGVLWFPFEVRVGWAPYRHGRWVWVSPWGWTWVDQAPWGFAPFHYGRWVHWQGRWGWWPGERLARPVYAPALVAWVGGSGWNVSVQVGGGPLIGWVPLAPRERFVPPYRHTPRHGDRLNPHRPGLHEGRDARDGVGGPPPRRDGPAEGRHEHPRGGPSAGGRDGRDRATGPWRNAQVPGAITVVSADVLQRRQPVPREGQEGWIGPVRPQPADRAEPGGHDGRAPGAAWPADPMARPDRGDRADRRDRSDGPERSERPDRSAPLPVRGETPSSAGESAPGGALTPVPNAAELQPVLPPPSQAVQPMQPGVRGQPMPGWREAETRMDRPAPGPVGAAAGSPQAEEPSGRGRERRAPMPAPVLPPAGAAAGPAAAPAPSAVPSLPMPAPVWRQRDVDARRVPAEDPRSARPPRAPEPPVVARPAPMPEERKFRPETRPGAPREAQR